jgi:hypothetical protein
VVQHIHKHTPVRPSAIRVGKLLAKAPIHGKPIVFRDGDKTYRAVIVRNFQRWAGATGKDLKAHILGDDSIDMME